MVSPAGNPFSPTFGTTPPFLAGREEVLSRFDEAVNAGPLHPDYTLLITGDRGTGKTALLNVLEDRVADYGWMTITASASSEPLPTRIVGEAGRCLERLESGRRRPKIRSISAMGVGIQLGHDPEGPLSVPSLLSTLEQLGAALPKEGTGLLLTVDELHDVTRSDVRDVAAAIQIVTRRRLRPIAFAAAALPLIEHTHLADAQMTFLQRCARASLGPLDPVHTRQALHKPIVRSGAAIDDDALAEATKATLGFPYMIQLIGFHAWRFREKPDQPISLTNVQAATSEAVHTMVTQIAAPVWNRLSPMEKRFLVAMLLDPTASELADIAERIGRTLQYARTYRRRLLDAGAVSPAADGRIRFRHHAMRTRARQAARNDPNLTRPVPLRAFRDRPGNHQHR